MDKAQINKIILLAMSWMRDDLAFEPAKIKGIVVNFVDDTPPLLTMLKNKVEVEDWNEVRFTIHKIKTRFSYFGFDEIEKQLSDWEEALGSGTAINNFLEKIEQVDQTATRIINVLEEINFDEPIISSETSNTSSEKKSVLIAEDDDVNAIILESFVSDWGGKSIRAHDGFEAIAKTVDDTPDLIIMDVHMPFLDGLDAIRAIRSKGVRTNIISMSASYKLSEKEETLKAGGNDFLTKPVTAHSMEKILEKYLGPKFE